MVLRESDRCFICMIIQVDIAAGGWHSTALTDDGEVSALFYLFKSFCIWV